MKCQTCKRSYIGQTERRLELGYKEHIRDISYNNVPSAYANHILANTHEYGPTAVTLLQSTQKCRCMNVLENHVIQFQRNNMIVNE